MRARSAAALGLLLAACATDPVVLRRSFIDGGEADAWQLPGGCPLRVGALRDLRSNPRALGELGVRQVTAEDFGAWARSGLDVMLQTRADAPLELEVEVLQAYMRPIVTSKAATLVLRVSYVRDGRPLQQKAYRGAETSMNWANAEGEMRGAFARSLREIARQVRADADGLCMAARPI